MTDMDRLISAAERLDLKANTERGLTLAGGGINFKYYTRVGTTQLHRYHHPHEKDFVPLDVAIEMDRKACAPINIGAGARLLGYRLEQVSAPKSEQSLTEAITTSIRECSEAHARSLEAGNARWISADGLRDICRESDEAIESLIRLKSKARSMLGEFP